MRRAGVVKIECRRAACGGAGGFRVARAGARRIPDDFTYLGLAGLSNELAEKLERVRPEDLGRASRIDGMTPAALSLLVAHLEK